MSRELQPRNVIGLVSEGVKPPVAKVIFLGQTVSGHIKVE